MAAQFDGKVALVTGGSGGIGRAACLAYAAEGAKVVVADILVDGGRETARMIEDGGGEAIFVETDVTSEAQVRAMVDKAVETYGQLDFAFNNAGIEGELIPAHEYTEEMWDRVIDINLKGVWLCIKHEVIHMMERGGGGAIVNTSSTSGHIGGENWTIYTASKHGVLGLTKSTAIEYGPKGIRVNAVCPSTTLTPMYDRALAGNEENQIQAHPLRRLGRPEDVAQTVIWLCSESASFITGQGVLVDGGALA